MLDQQQLAVGLYDPSQLRDRALGIGHRAEDQGADDGVEAAIFKRKPLCFGLQLQNAPTRGPEELRPHLAQAGLLVARQQAVVDRGEDPMAGHDLPRLA